jgi:uncharacterized protein (DUF1499 family)
MSGKPTITLAITAIICMIAGPGLAHAGLLPPMAGLALFTLSGLIGLGALVAAALSALFFRAYFAALIGILGCLPLIAVAAGTIDALRYPAINDIATDTANPPAFIHAPTLPELAGRDLKFPPANAGLIVDHYPEMKPLHLKEAPLQVHERARALAASKEFGWTVTEAYANYGGFEAIAETRLFRWKDDVVLRIQPDGEGACIVDMRSKSRQGKSDLGANARRIRRFLEALQK